MLDARSLADIPQLSGTDVPSGSAWKHRRDNACEERAENQQPNGEFLAEFAGWASFFQLRPATDPRCMYLVRLFEYTETHRAPLSHIARLPGSADNGDGG